MEKPSLLVLKLRELIREYCMRHMITTITAFAQIARLDRDTISDICNKPYNPSWRVVTAIAVAVDVPTERIKRELGPLYDQTMGATKRTTTHQRIIASDLLAQREVV